MGAVGVLAMLEGRRGSRLYALALAAVLTLAVDPSVATDIGWQLSFAAVLGILSMAAPLRRVLVARLGNGPWRRALAEGLAVTVAATLATAPLIAFHFETLSTTTLLANVLAMPAVAPAMWLGMCSAALAQVPGVPLEPLNGLNALLLAYVAQIASWCAAPEWAELRVQLGGVGLVLSYLGMIAVGLLGLYLARLRLLRPALSGLSAAAVVAVAVLVGWPGGGRAATAITGLRVEVIDVGQGDAILFQPADAPAVLVDGGPPGDDLRRKLEDAGVRELGAAVITHDQSDHAAGVEELLGRVPIGHLIYARLGRRTLAEAEDAGVEPERIAAGRELRSGALRLRVLWPPPELLSQSVPGEDPNSLAVVMEARWRDFTMLLTADAEAETVPLDPGPVDVLKVAHHGSDDAGLGALLDRTRPQLAVISVGDDNPYGHPTRGTLSTLAAHRVPTLRTDEEGDVVLDVGNGSFHLDG
jgi:competence protein ComEC